MKSNPFIARDVAQSAPNPIKPQMKLGGVVAKAGKKKAKKAMKGAIYGSNC